MLLSLVFDALCGPQFELVVQIMSHLPVLLGAVVVVMTKEMPRNNSSLLNYSLLWYDTHDLRNLFSCMNHNGTCNQAGDSFKDISDDNNLHDVEITT